MRLKHKTFYSISLALPYLALLLGGAVLAFAYAVRLDAAGFSGLSGILLAPILFFAASCIVWAPLYTWMVAVLFFWGFLHMLHLDSLAPTLCKK